jgi:hypothetical protein
MWNRLSSEVAWVAPARSGCHVPCRINFSFRAAPSYLVLRLFAQCSSFCGADRAYWVLWGAYSDQHHWPISAIYCLSKERLSEWIRRDNCCLFWEVAWVAPAKSRCHVPCNVNYFHPYPVSRRVLQITLRAVPFLALNRRASAAFGGTVGLRNQCYSKVCLTDALLNQRNSIRYPPLSMIS